MKNNLKAALWFFILSLAICCVLYPAVLLVIGGVLFPSNSTGSMITATGDDGKEKIVGSRLIAQPFTKDWYFQPRPSAASYNGAVASGSNWGANNPKLRDRVARQLGPMVRYNQNGPKKNDSVQTDIETWFVGYKPKGDEKPLVVKWASNNGTLAAVWVKADANKPGVIAWLETHPNILADWKKGKKDAPEVKLDDNKTIPFDDIVGAFFESWAAAYPNQWPETEEYETRAKDNKGEAVKAKRFKAVTTGSDLQATFFDLWLQTNPKADLEKVPADMVLASGAGLDPHITVRNARYQLDRVVEKRSAKPADATRVKDGISKLIEKYSFTPLSGLVGEPLINVLELNIELDREFPLPPAPQKT